MTWVKLDDQFPEHPKVMALGKDRLPGMGLWLVGAGYCGRHLTDGFIPRAFLVGSEQIRLARCLVGVGLWEDVSGGYRMHDYHDYQPAREEVLERRRLKAEAGRLGGLRSGQQRSKRASTREAPPKATASSLVEANAKQTGKQNPSNGGSTPVPQPVPETPRRSSVSVSVPRDAIVLEGQTRPDLVALRQRGMTYIRQSELAILDAIADNERDESRPISVGQQVVADWIAEAPKGVHLVDFVIQRENDLKRERGFSADEADAAWQRTKEADRTSAPERLGSIVERLTGTG